jgi:hypothetical protein
MAEEEIVVTGQEPPVEVAPAQTNDFTGSFRMSFTPQEFVDLYDTFDAAAKEPGSEYDSGMQAFASSLVESLSYDPYLSDKIGYNDLRTGTAPILKELGLEGQSLTDEQIIELFAQDDKGGDIVADPGFYQGVKRRALPGVGFAGGFYAGAKAGNIAMAGVPPVTPWTAAARIGVPLVTGIVGGVGASYLGEGATNVMMGKEPIVLPGASSYEAGKTFADTLPFVLTPWAVPAKGFSIGGQQAVKNAENFIGPLINGTRRVPLSSKFVAKTEDLIQGMGTVARANPYKTAAVEGGGLIGTTLLAGQAEEIAPGNPWVRFGFETTGGISGALLADLAANRVPALAAWTGRGIKNLYESALNRNPSEMQSKYNISDSDFKNVATFITEQLEKNGEDPLALLEALNDPRFDKFLFDANNKRVELDPATRSASVTLLALQNQFGQLNPGAFGSDATSQMKASIDALRRGLLSLYANGSETALQDAAIIQTALFEGVLDSKIALATNKTVEAMKRVRGTDTNVDLESAQTIFDVLDSQYKAGRAEESSLWKLIPQNIELREFIDENGVTTNVPNFITTYNRLLGDEPPEIKDALERADELKFLSQFVDRKTKEMGLNAGDSVPPAMPALPEQKKLQTALDKIAGTDNSGLPQTIVDAMQAEGSSIDSIVAALKSEAQNALDSSKSGPQASLFETVSKAGTDIQNRELATALNAQADFLTAQQRQAKEFKDAAGQGAEETQGLGAYELTRLRSRAMSMGRRLSADGKNEEARLAYEMADAMLADLNSLGIGENQAYDTARSFSKAFNDVFTRAYAGEVLGTKKNGANKVPIEVIASNMMKGDAAFMKAAALDGIAQFQTGQALTNLLQAEAGPEFAQTGQQLLGDLEQYFDPVTGTIDMPGMRQWYGQNAELIKTVPNLNTRIVNAMNTATSIRGAEENLLRTLRANTLNEDGTLNTGALSNWMNQENNKRLLEMFPALSEDLKDVRKASTLITSTKADNAKALADEKNGIGLYELLPDKTSNATTVVSKALSINQTRPFAIMNKYMRMINNVGEDGFTVLAENSQNVGQTWTQADLKDGMRKAIYDSIFEVASNGERFSPGAAYNRLFTEHPNGNGVSVADWMLGNELVNKKQLEDTEQFLKKMQEIEIFTTKARPGQTDEFFQDIGEGVKILAAMGGSVAGTSLRNMFGGASDSGQLIAAGRGATFGQNLANKYMAELPQSLQAGRVQTVIENEELLRKALKTGKTQREKNALLAQIQEMFIQNYVVMPTRRIGGEAIQETTSSEENLRGQEIPPVPVPTGNGENIPATGNRAAPVNQAPTQLAPVTPSGPPIQAPAPPPAPAQNLNPSRFQQGSAAPSGPVDRAKFAALFPEDRELLGIGSLMGQA